MPNAMDVHKILQRLKNDTDTELMRYELELMLERELAKPASEMDAQLVQELLDALEEDPAECDKQRVWESIEKQTRRSAGLRHMTAVRRVAACVLALFVVSLISIGSAYAFNWSFLLKFLKPLAETFGIYSANHLNTPQPEQSVTLYTDEDTGFEQVFYNSAEEMPAEWKGYRVQPAWLPERFSFLQGSLYADYSVAIISASYTAEEDFFNLVTTFFCNDEDVSSYEYQKTTGEPITEIIAGLEVTYYRNLNENSLSASWINKNAHYSVIGDVTEDELREIIQGLVE